MKELLLVCIGSFFGGGARYLVSKAVQSWVAANALCHLVHTCQPRSRTHCRSAWLPNCEVNSERIATMSHDV